MDHYNTLGVSKTATPDEIKKAYRKLASQHHPDKGGDKAKFQEIQAAYDTLSNSDNRKDFILKVEFPLALNISLVRCLVAATRLTRLVNNAEINRKLSEPQ
jgi:curved DNA-binding protein CbpA